MPLCTEMIRKGKRVTPTGKGWAAVDVSAMLTLAFLEEGIGDDLLSEGVTFKDVVDGGKVVDFMSFGAPYLIDSDKYPVPLLKRGKQTLKNDYEFVEDYGEVMKFKKGDILKMWRE